MLLGQLITRRFVSTGRKLPEYGFSQLKNKGLISVKGPDSLKFLNGLVTSKLLPNIVKKKATTISDDNVDETLSLKEFNHDHLNWGFLKESPISGNQIVSRNGIYSMFLNSKGRVVADTFIYPYKYNELSETPQLIIELDKDVLKTVLGVLKLHKLKAKVEIQEVNDLKVWFVYNDYKRDALYELQSKYFDEESKTLKSPKDAIEAVNEFLQDETIWNDTKDVLAFSFDDRCPDFGVRIITPSSVNNLSGIFSDQFLPHSTESLDVDTITTRRYLFGIPEGQLELKPNKLLPLECNLEYMGGVNFDKGCYVGQELTVRTFHTGIVRKRIVPIKLYLYDQNPNDVELVPEDSLTFDNKDLPLSYVDIYSDKDENKAAATTGSSPFEKRTTSRRSSRRSSGTLLSTNGDIGLALVRLEDFADPNTKFSVEVPRAGEENKTLKIGVKAFIPYWWPEE